jgi:hypothetical protein
VTETRKKAPRFAGFARDYGRLPSTVTTLHVIAFGMRMPTRLLSTTSPGSAYHALKKNVPELSVRARILAETK